MKIHKNNFLFIVAFLVFSACLFLGLIFFLPKTGVRQAEIFFLDVGQGDSTLIRSGGGQNILVDGGPDQRVVFELSKILPFFERTIDLMILTHPHDDHVGGLNEVIERYQVKQILYTGAPHTGPAFLKWLESVRDRKITMKIIDQPQTIVLGEGEKLEVFWPLEDLRLAPPDNLNNSSIVMKYCRGQASILLTGDIEAAVEKELLAEYSDLRADIIKLGHHGSDTSSSENFLKAVSPSFAIVSAGQNNQFGHPSDRVLARLYRREIEVLKTAEEGTISFVFNPAAAGQAPIRRRPPLK